MSGAFYVGTSGFAYKEWKGDFYPAGIRDSQMLSWYAARLPSVEINYTFQRYPSPQTIDRWIAETPENFRLSPKANRGITHIRRLMNAGESLTLFLQSVQGLGPRIGAILFQCPPTLAIDVALLEDFLAILPSGGRYAFEFRHESWNEDVIRGALAARDAAWCVADTDDLDASFERTAAGYAYVRLRKSSYDDEALSRWMKAMGEALEDGADVYCYLKHEDSARGIDYARALMRLHSAGGE